jgi:hypothetical protein
LNPIQVTAVALTTVITSEMRAIPTVIPNTNDTSNSVQMKFYPADSFCPLGKHSFSIESLHGRIISGEMITLANVIDN